MKKFLLTLFTIIIIAGALGGAGMAGYRYGYSQGTIANADGNSNNAPLGPGNGLGWNRMPMHDHPGMGFGYHHQRFGMGGYGMMGRGGGFGFFSPFHGLTQLAVLVFIVWLVYKFLTGWRISLTKPGQETTQPKNE